MMYVAYILIMQIIARFIDLLYILPGPKKYYLFGRCILRSSGGLLFIVPIVVRYCMLWYVLLLLVV